MNNVDYLELFRSIQPRKDLELKIVTFSGSLVAGADKLVSMPTAFFVIDATFTSTDVDDVTLSPFYINCRMMYKDGFVTRPSGDRYFTDSFELYNPASESQDYTLTLIGYELDKSRFSRNFNDYNGA